MSNVRTYCITSANPWRFSSFEFICRWSIVYSKPSRWWFSIDHFLPEFDGEFKLADFFLRFGDDGCWSSMGIEWLLVDIRRFSPTNCWELICINGIKSKRCLPIKRWELLRTYWWWSSFRNFLEQVHWSSWSHSSNQIHSKMIFI